MREKFNQLQENPFINLFTKLITTAIIGFILLTFVFGVTVYHKIDMSPHIKDGDLLITYKLNKNIYSDLVVSYKYNNETKYGRIIGVPGDTIYINKEGNYTINGNVPVEKIYYNTYPSAESAITYPYIIPTDSYFILNDYRDNTQDSREFGAINKKDITGQMLLQLRRRGF